MRRTLVELWILLILPGILWSQEEQDYLSVYPVFPECQNTLAVELPSCFNNAVRQKLVSQFSMPAALASENYRGDVSVLFEVLQDGSFQLIYVDTAKESIREEVTRIMNEFPTIQGPTYNGKPTYMQFTVRFQVPLGGIIMETTAKGETGLERNAKGELIEYDAVEQHTYTDREFTSNINIPLSHHNYSLFDPYLNQVGSKNHTAQKPYVYSEVNKYYDFAAEKQAISKDRKSWFGRKWWNEHMVAFQGKNYWVTLDPGVDLQAGKDFDDDIDTYNNTRLVYAQGGIGKQLGFFAVVYESQGRFAGYFNRYAESIRPDGGNPAIIPARGIAKQFRDDSYDYPLATGHISYTPSTYFNIQLGHGKNFIGDGYRSLFMSDNASPYPFFKINTTFWKIKYTNTWMSLRDVRPEVTADGSFRTKYMATHYLSYNITKRLNIGLFESVIWENDNDRGFDFNYLNPVIFYRAIEFSTGSRGGNALIGISAKYKVNNRVNLYSQLIIDEFSSGDIFGGNGSYKNKIGYQLGGKYYNAFGVPNLYLQAEYNRVRPYTYSHNTVILNYGHNNQSMAHTLGASFSEFIGIARYQHGRIFGDAKFVVAKRGFDFNTEEDSLAYGGDVYSSEDNRPMNDGNDLAQGNTADFFHMELTGGYLINPATNLKVYAGFIFRNLSPDMDTPTVFKEQTSWLNFGIRTDLFNWYNDF